eukprot:CAMPEP_0201489760 /NCGR_PEP_ID=MMETSP0151_2-20130828/23584_1 /ASSEMBLY_ACC=CAM_ASM_000257 /TAXON_ID=200890 /ORGANISM="Paramoeba atlantica, Strain 621/1 / CCAP 1560/9" /LENGTH=615 /DNA_ID=CAMNT_0047875451 /DNA_START=141 /DNA_END=1988 /DNA_ORIENTATION=+
MPVVGDEETPTFGDYRDETLPATSTSILLTKKYIVSAIFFFVLLFFIVILVLVVGVDIFQSEDNEKNFWRGNPLKVKNGAVATESAFCSDLGVQILEERQGNSIDAVVVTDLCLGIVHCFATNMGGGGVMVIYDENTQEIDVLDYRETAPMNSTSDMYVINDWSSTVGPLAAAVPGTLRGLHQVHQEKKGAIAWETLLLIASDVAASFTVDALLAERLEEQKDYVLADPGLSGVFAPNGELLQEGDTCNWKSLSDTLAAVGVEGPDILYGGSLGEDLIADMQQSNPESIMNIEDLAKYKVFWRTPIKSFYRGYEVFGAPPPFTGGPILAQAFNILEQYNIPLLGNVLKSQHYLVQSLLFGYSDRTGMGDPLNPYNGEEGMETFLIPTMVSKEHAATLRPKISPTQTFPINYYEDLVPLQSPNEDHGTSSFSVYQKNGLAIVVTSTINLSFGSKFMSPKTGLILNNEMDDFSTPDETNSFGFPPSESNFPYPEARPASSMTPTIITKNNVPYLIIGGSGGSMIISGTFTSILNYMDFEYNLYNAVSRPRLHDQWVPDTLYWEKGYPSSWKEKLGHDYGYNVSDSSRGGAVVQAISFDGENIYAASDRRKDGRPDGY